MPPPSSRIRDIARAQRRGDAGFGAKDALRWLSFVCLIVSGFFWFPMRWHIVAPQGVPDALIAISTGLFMVIGVPVLTSFLIPWSPAGMFLQKINARTWGHVVVIACSLFLLYYAYTYIAAWWALRPTDGVFVADPGTEAIIGIISTILVPALLWAPVSADELVELARQEHAIKRYELAAAADIAAIQARLLEAQRIAAKRLAETTADERSWLHGTMQGLMTGMDQTLREVAGNVRSISNTYAAYESLSEHPEAIGILDYIADTLHTAPDDDSHGEPHVNDRAAHVRAAHHVDSRPQSLIHVTAPRADVRQRPSVTDTDESAEYTATIARARELLPPVWTKRKLAEVFQRDERTVQRWIADWKSRGWITDVNLGRYSFTEPERTNQ